jgi:hydroxymethylpyrimidine pyrophosphatase-like HAD family hydrolase
MPLNQSQYQQLRDFLSQSQFEETGGVITDLDGTAIHEFEGQFSIPQSVELGLKRIYDLGRPVVLNTLRFPLSVIRTFGKEWYKLSNAPIPTVLMNGSQLGYVDSDKSGNFEYREIAAFPLDRDEISQAVDLVESFVSDGVSNLLVFYYPRDWQQGEIIWVPRAETTEGVRKKYLSASKVYSSPLAQLRENLLHQQICMIFLLVDIPQDRLMAYQHTKRSNFFTHKNVDKSFGAEKIAGLLGFSLEHSIGAGDSEMDNFLTRVGLAVHVGNPHLSYKGLLPALKLNNSSEFGELLLELGMLQRNNTN